MESLAVARLTAAARGGGSGDYLLWQNAGCFSVIGRFCRRNVDLSRTRVPVDDTVRIELTIGVTQSTDQGELTPRILHLPGPAALLNVRSPRVIIFTCSFDHFTWYGRSSVTSCNMYEGPGDF